MTLLLKLMPIALDSEVVIDTNVVVSAVLTRGKPEAVSRLRMATLKDDSGA